MDAAGVGACCDRAGRGDACRNSFHHWTRPKTRLDRRRRGVDRTRVAVSRRGSLARSPRIRSSRAFGPCGTTTEASPGCSTAGSTEDFRRCRINSLSLDILVQNWREIPLATLFAKRWPGLAIVLDHCGKPDIARDAVSILGHRHIDQLASLPHVVCKLSGLLNCARSGADAADLEIYIKHVLDAFDPSRVMWGSDWPPLDLASDYARWKHISDSALQTLPDFQRREVIERTAMRVYQLNC